MTNNLRVPLKEKISLGLKKLRRSAAEAVSTPGKRKILQERVMGHAVSFLKYILVIGLCFVILYPILLQLAVAFRAPSDVG